MYGGKHSHITAPHARIIRNFKQPCSVGGKGFTSAPAVHLSAERLVWPVMKFAIRKGAVAALIMGRDDAGN